MDGRTPVPNTSSRRYPKGRSSHNDVKKSKTRHGNGPDKSSPPRTHRRNSTTDTRRHHQGNSSSSKPDPQSPISPPLQSSRGRSNTYNGSKTKNHYHHSDHPYHSAARHVNNRGRNNKPEHLPNRKKLVIISTEDIKIPSHGAFDYIHCKVDMVKKASWKLYDAMLLIVPTTSKKDSMLDICKRAKKSNPKLFICIIDRLAGESAVFRSRCFNHGANMVTNDFYSLKQVQNTIGNRGHQGKGSYECPYCGMDHLTEDELWHHVPLYHINESKAVHCPICDTGHLETKFLSHLRNRHGPVSRGEMSPEYREGISTHAFALVVVRRPSDSKFLVVQEAADSGFWLPGGRVQVGETLIEAAERETKEEAGIRVQIKGILKVEHSTYCYDERDRAYNRMRVIFYAEPAHEEEHAKSVPSYHSAGASFISVDELDDIRLRGEEPRDYFTSLMQNFYYHPLDILSCWKHDKRTPDRQQNCIFGSPPAKPIPNGPPPSLRQTTLNVELASSPPPPNSNSSSSVNGRRRRTSKGHRHGTHRKEDDPYSPESENYDHYEMTVSDSEEPSFSAKEDPLARTVESSSESEEVVERQNEGVISPSPNEHDTIRKRPPPRHQRSVSSDHNPPTNSNMSSFPEPPQRSAPATPIKPKVVKTRSVSTSGHQTSHHNSHSNKHSKPKRKMNGMIGSDVGNQETPKNKTPSPRSINNQHPPHPQPSEVLVAHGMQQNGLNGPPRMFVQIGPNIQQAHPLQYSYPNMQISHSPMMHHPHQGSQDNLGFVIAAENNTFFTHHPHAVNAVNTVNTVDGTVGTTYYSPQPGVPLPNGYLSNFQQITSPQQQMGHGHGHNHNHNHGHGHSLSFTNIPFQHATVSTVPQQQVVYQHAHSSMTEQQLMPYRLVQQHSTPHLSVTSPTAKSSQQHSQQQQQQQQQQMVTNIPPSKVKSKNSNHSSNGKTAKLQHSMESTSTPNPHKILKVKSNPNFVGGSGRSISVSHSNGHSQNHSTSRNRRGSHKRKRSRKVVKEDVSPPPGHALDIKHRRSQSGSSLPTVGGSSKQ